MRRFIRHLEGCPSQNPGEAVPSAMERQEAGRRSFVSAARTSRAICEQPLATGLTVH